MDEKTAWPKKKKKKKSASEEYSGLPTGVDPFSASTLPRYCHHVFLFYVAGTVSLFLLWTTQTAHVDFFLSNFFPAALFFSLC